ncbi:DUF928 domain-containing protein [Leptothoe spongobia]|uniref:DUF928 domain-containing protein n=1 Tax=Leptothoe spongobia TAU-MAC 1115 TaxID=1967444 RepID=A0A947GHN2_9CYAN|nr:DUF928 domain-containing protein [Leptothoe spongobia]MBT9314833.1 DUF928 domain-containing protein [Leptothoe spongobia TAU-MAC 1115]
MMSRIIMIFTLVIILSLSDFTKHDLSAIAQPYFSAKSNVQTNLTKILTSKPIFFIAEEQGFGKQAQNQQQANPPRRERRNRSFWARLQDLGRRGSCGDLNPPLIALMPSSINDQALEWNLLGELQDALAFTVNSYPTFWFYIPELLQKVEVAEFMMQDENGKDIFEQPIYVRLETSGIVGLELPNQERPLVPNTPYHWYFSPICDSERPARNPSIDGWVERISTNTTVELQAQQDNVEMTIEELYSVNAWYDALALLLNLRCDDPKNSALGTYWPSMLEALNLPKATLSETDFCPQQRQLQVIYNGQSADTF